MQNFSGSTIDRTVLRFAPRDVKCDSVFHSLAVNFHTNSNEPLVAFRNTAHSVSLLLTAPGDWTEPASFNSPDFHTLPLLVILSPLQVCFILQTVRVYKVGGWRVPWPCGPAAGGSNKDRSNDSENKSGWFNIAAAAAPTKPPTTPRSHDVTTKKTGRRGLEMERRDR